MAKKGSGSTTVKFGSPCDICKHKPEPIYDYGTHKIKGYKDKGCKQQCNNVQFDEVYLDGLHINHGYRQTMEDPGEPWHIEDYDKATADITYSDGVIEKDVNLDKFEWIDYSKLLDLATEQYEEDSGDDDYD